MERWLALALALSATLAGCGEKAAVPVGIPVDADGDPLPTVEGFVVDEAIRPMAGVVMRILGDGTETATDDEGHYALVRPTILAENILVAAIAPGYVPRSQQVQASGHTSARMDFRLEPDPHQVARVEVLQRTGVLACQVHSAFGTQVCEPPSAGTGGVEPATAEEVWAIDTSIALAGAVVQVHWDAETAAAQHLTARLRGPVVGCCSEGNGGSKGEVHAEATGASPLRLELGEEAARAFPSWSALWVEVSLADAQPGTPAGVARAQTFEAYASIFYVDAAPPGYTLG